MTNLISDLEGRMNTVVYFLLAALLFLFAYGVFHIFVRRDYAAKGRLSALSSGLQLLVFIAFFGFPYQFNPPEWAWFWKVDAASSLSLYIAGLLVICIGFVVAFVTMSWFGIKRVSGMHVDKLKKEGPYRISRNPQILGGYLIVIGISIQRPSLYALGWVLMYAVIAHWMVLGEEEHLLRFFGKEYEVYCLQVPRYLIAGRMHAKLPPHSSAKAAGDAGNLTGKDM